MINKKTYLGLKIKNKMNPSKFNKINRKIKILQKGSKIYLKIIKLWKINNHFKNSPIHNDIKKTINSQNNHHHLQEIPHSIFMVTHPNHHTIISNILPIKILESTHKTYQQILNNMDLHQPLSYNKCKVLITIL